MQNYKNLEVWEKAHRLALAVYKATEAFPHDEIFGLTSQVRRASVSIPSNIAEGCGRGGSAELQRFLYYALGSANELEYQLMLAHELGILSAENHKSLNSEVGETRKKLISLVKKLKSANPEFKALNSKPITINPKPITWKASSD